MCLRKIGIFQDCTGVKLTGANCSVWRLLGVKWEQSDGTPALLSHIGYEGQETCESWLDSKVFETWCLPEGQTVNSVSPGAPSLHL